MTAKQDTHTDLIETYWDVKKEKEEKQLAEWLDLIETYWDVKERKKHTKL